ncbi:MAG: sigma-54-dependent Fis family transcriptional regulator, partial [Gammaproteobacteria bacterium]|nr:sigma-54-dependent Fis family transcriptional regulator [Gammaproteobacteria bacterium]
MGESPLAPQPSQQSEPALRPARKLAPIPPLPFFATIAFMAFMPHLLLAHDDLDQRTTLGGILEKGGYQVTASGLRDAPDHESLGDFDAILASPEAVKRRNLSRRRGNCPLIVLADGGDVRQAVEAIKQGAADYLALPVEAGELLSAVGNALAALSTQSEDQRRPPFTVIGSSGAMVEVRERIAQIAPTDSAVLIEGESGTGKDFLAHAIHAASLRNQAPFITVNCAAIPDAMIETELFGQRFSPATGRAGLADAASGGTLYLDEVGELPLEVQARLLAMLDQSAAEDRASGSSPPRIIATSHRNVRQLAERGYFHEMLSRHLNETRLQLPPLRDRQHDAIELAHHLLGRFCRKLGKPLLRISEDAIRAIEAYHWPGNVRELSNLIERAAILCDGEEIDATMLAIDSDAPRIGDFTSAEGGGAVSLEDYFIAYVTQHQDQLTETELAERLGISRKSLWERRQRLNMPRT